jgi:hypothetical protein
MPTGSVTRFVNFLVMECEDTGQTTFVNTMLAAAKAQILAGQGSIGFLTTASANGKAVTQVGSLTADEIAWACRTALRTYEGTRRTGPFTFLDFSTSETPYPNPIFP